MHKHTDRASAGSDTIREKRWNWYVDDFSARLKPGAKRILMNTRWHEEDVAGRVLEQIERKDIKGRVISIPAIAEENDPLGRRPGEYLWDDPTGYNYGAFLRARQRETSPMMWAALYQQRPAPEEGDFFKAAWLKPCEKLPSKDTLRVYGTRQSSAIVRQLRDVARDASSLVHSEHVGYVRISFGLAA